MKAIDLFKAMQSRTAIYIPTTNNGTLLALVDSMICEDGSGASWIVHVHTIFYSDLHLSLYIRTTDNGKQFKARVIV